MVNKNSLTPEESFLFREAMREVTPLTSHNHSLPLSKKKKSLSLRIPSIKKPDESWDYSLSKELNATDIMRFARNGISWKQVQKLKRGHLNNPTLDLHYQTVPEAQASVARFIEKAIQNRNRWVCIIHGKGLLSSAQKPILKNFLNHYLREHAQVLAFHSAPPNNGGSGALYLLLKSKASP
jgi:DNA-nicking Smr family endonuclease